MKWMLGCVLAVAALSSCTKDRNVEPIPVVVDSTAAAIVPGVIKINEIVAKGSLNMNEFNQASDWFELYNTSNKPVTLEAGKWFCTDKGSLEPIKYALPAWTVPANGFLVIWCDTLNTVATQIHTNFNLSANGEDIGLFYKNESDSLIKIDGVVYPIQTINGYSYGRFADGAENWQTFSVPTPGAPNH
jgi:hypothetical protein